MRELSVANPELEDSTSQTNETLRKFSRRRYSAVFDKQFVESDENLSGYPVTTIGVFVNRAPSA